jgi:hypothetical protein
LFTQEGKDKQFLLNRIYELTGEKPGAKKRESRPPPPSSGPAPTVKTVNEVNDKNGKVPIDNDVSVVCSWMTSELSISILEVKLCNNCNVIWIYEKVNKIFRNKIESFDVMKEKKKIITNISNYLQG